MSNINRPTNFDDIIGQKDVLERLRITTEGSKKTGGVMPHILIDGPPGLGKTTIATAIANEIGVNLFTTNAANLRSVKNIIPYLTRITNQSILFIDEIHRLPKLVEEFLYPVMEDFKISLIIEKEPVEIELPRFTLIGATTSAGCLSQPFYDRFSIKEHLSFYTDEDLAKLARSNASKLGLNIDDNSLLEIAKRSKGTPRILNSRLQWVHHYQLCNPDKKIDAGKVLELQGIDSNGLDEYDRQYIGVLKAHRGIPLGVRSLSAMSGIALETIENSIEPYLVRKGFVRRTQKGRVIGNI